MGKAVYPVYGIEKRKLLKNRFLVEESSHDFNRIYV